MTELTEEMGRKIGNGYYSGKDIPYIPFKDFDIKLRLRGEDKKRFKTHIAPDVESLFKNKEIQKSATRFADLFLANVLDGYRRRIHHGVELARDKTSKKSIQNTAIRDSKKVKKPSERTVKGVIGYLLKTGLIKEEDALQVFVPEEYGPIRNAILAKHKIENKPYIFKIHTLRSTVLVATDKLQKLMTDVETSKRCSECGDRKELSMFPPKESVCKDCKAKRKRELRAKKKTEANQK